ncbi:MAG: hypothetical protein K9K78_01975 [Spirochaetales bacterium]|nr:hypothetical protein [Spirochaetales bacterium]
MQIGFSALDAADKTSWEKDSVLFYFASSESGFRLYDSSGAFVMDTAQQGIISENWIIQTLDSTSVEIETYAGTQRCRILPDSLITIDKSTASNLALFVLQGEIRCTSENEDAAVAVSTPSSTYQFTNSDVILSAGTEEIFTVLEGSAEARNDITRNEFTIQADESINTLSENKVPFPDYIDETSLSSTTGMYAYQKIPSEPSDELLSLLQPEEQREPELSADIEPEETAVSKLPEERTTELEDSETQLEPEPKPDIEVEAEPEPKIEPEPEPKAEPVPEPKLEPEPKAEPVPEPKLEPEPEAEPVPEPKLESEPEAEPVPEPKLEPEPEPEAEPVPEPKLEPEPEAEPVPEPVVELAEKPAEEAKGKELEELEKEAPEADGAEKKKAVVFEDLADADEGQAEAAAEIAEAEPKAEEPEATEEAIETSSVKELSAPEEVDKTSTMVAEAPAEEEVGSISESADEEDSEIEIEALPQIRKAEAPSEEPADDTSEPEAGVKIVREKDTSEPAAADVPAERSQETTVAVKPEPAIQDKETETAESKEESDTKELALAEAIHMLSKQAAASKASEDSTSEKRAESEEPEKDISDEQISRELDKEPSQKTAERDAAELAASKDEVPETTERIEKDDQAEKTVQHIPSEPVKITSEAAASEKAVPEEVTDKTEVSSKEEEVSEEPEIGKETEKEIEKAEIPAAEKEAAEKEAAEKEIEEVKDETVIASTDEAGESVEISKDDKRETASSTENGGFDFDLTIQQGAAYNLEEDFYGITEINPSISIGDSFSLGAGLKFMYPLSSNPIEISSWYSPRGNLLWNYGGGAVGTNKVLDIIFDSLSLIDHIQLGSPEDTVFLSAGTMDSLSLGTGFMLNNMDLNIDSPYISRTGLHHGLNSQFVDYQLIINDITYPEIGAFRLAGRPIGNKYPFEIGVGGVVDFASLPTYTAVTEQSALSSSLDLIQDIIITPSVDVTVPLIFGKEDHSLALTANGSMLMIVDGLQFKLNSFYDDGSLYNYTADAGLKGNIQGFSYQAAFSAQQGILESGLFSTDYFWRRDAVKNDFFADYSTGLNDDLSWGIFGSAGYDWDDFSVTAAYQLPLNGSFTPQWEDDHAEIDFAYTGDHLALSLGFSKRGFIDTALNKPGDFIDPDRIQDGNTQIYADASFTQNAFTIGGKLSLINDNILDVSSGTSTIPAVSVYTGISLF